MQQKYLSSEACNLSFLSLTSPIRCDFYAKCMHMSCLIGSIVASQGENPKKPGSPHNVRLYSIASTRYGDSFNGKTTSLCVRRAVYYDPETGKEDPSKNGVCSNFLCNSKPGDKIRITGKILFI